MNWTENGIEKSTDSLYSFTVNKNVVIQANFSPETSISELGTVSTIHIFPNPASGMCKITGLPDNKPSLAKICNTDGKVLINKTINETESVINIENLSSGLYFIVISGDSFLYTQKLIKRKD